MIEIHIIHSEQILLIFSDSLVRCVDGFCPSQLFCGVTIHIRMFPGLNQHYTKQRTF